MLALLRRYSDLRRTSAQLGSFVEDLIDQLLLIFDILLCLVDNLFDPNQIVTIFQELLRHLIDLDLKFMDPLVVGRVHHKTWDYVSVWPVLSRVECITLLILFYFYFLSSVALRSDLFLVGPQLLFDLFFELVKVVFLPDAGRA